MSKSSIKKKLENFLKGDKENNEPSNEKPLTDDKSSNEENEEGAPFDPKDVMGDCPSCFRDTKELMENTLNFHNDYDKLLAKDYCENHNDRYVGHKCKPHWCGDCGFLIKYVVEIDHSKANYDR